MKPHGTGTRNSEESRPGDLEVATRRKWRRTEECCWVRISASSPRSAIMASLLQDKSIFCLGRELIWSVEEYFVFEMPLKYAITKASNILQLEVWEWILCQHFLDEFINRCRTVEVYWNKEKQMFYTINTWSKMLVTKVVAVGHSQAEFRITLLVNLHNFGQLIGNWNEEKLSRVRYNFKWKGYHIDLDS